MPWHHLFNQRIGLLDPIREPAQLVAASVQGDRRLATVAITGLGDPVAVRGFVHAAIDRSAQVPLANLLGSIFITHPLDHQMAHHWRKSRSGVSEFHFHGGTIAGPPPS